MGVVNGRSRATQTYSPIDNPLSPVPATDIGRQTLERP